MALIVVPQQGVAAAPAVLQAGADPLYARAIAQYQNDREAGLQIIRDLTGRIRALELNLTQERLQRNENQHLHEDQLFQERLQREHLSQQLNHATQQFQNLTVLVDQKIQQVQRLEQLREQDARVILAGREEIQALTQQVAQQREQVRQLGEQLQASIAQANALSLQMNQMARQIDQQQQLILQGQVEQRKLLDQLKPQKSALDSAAEKVFDIAFRAPLSLFFPRLYKYDNK